MNIEDWAPSPLLSSSLNGVRSHNCYLRSLGLCGCLHSSTYSELSEVAPSFELLKGKRFLLSVLVSPAPAAVAITEWWTVNVCWTIESLWPGGASGIFWKTPLCIEEKTGLGRNETMVRPLLNQALRALCREEQGGAVLAHVWSLEPSTPVHTEEMQAPHCQLASHTHFIF